jgi:Flp pilus assembly protein TadG
MNQRGSLATEFALLAPILLLLFSVAIGGARTWMARAGVEQMAGAAARAASLERTVGQAQQRAGQLATAQAAAGGVRCQVLEVEVDASALSRPVGTAGTVTATVHCEVALADVLVPGWPGSLAVAATASAVVDSYRGRK